MNIKFRAWDTTERCWQLNVFDGVSPEGRAFYISDSGQEWCDEYVLVQYTGLLDKNGKEIYEGDILSTGRWPELVRYENGCFVLTRMYLHLALSNYHYEVIGNIYENKDLVCE